MYSQDNVQLKKRKDKEQA